MATEPYSEIRITIFLLCRFTLRWWRRNKLLRLSLSYAFFGIHHFFALPQKNGGRERIRTSEACVQQIYSLPPLATWVPVQIFTGKVFLPYKILPAV